MCGKKRRKNGTAANVHLFGESCIDLACCSCTYFFVSAILFFNSGSLVEESRECKTNKAVLGSRSETTSTKRRSANEELRITSTLSISFALRFLPARTFVTVTAAASQ